MAEVKHTSGALRKFATRMTEEPQADDAISREHQTNAQAFALSLVFKDQRRRQTFPWSLYGGHEWTDDGDMETILAVFGEHGCMVRGYRFKLLDRDMSLGKRATIREHTKSQVEMMLAEESDEPIVVSIQTFPGIAEMLSVLKGAPDEYRNARHTE